jgi:hypothetical protein
MASKEDYIAAVAATAARLDGVLKKRFLQAIEDLRDKVDWRQIAEWLEQGRPDLVMGVFSTELLNSGYAGFGAGLTEAFIVGGTMAASFVPPFVDNTTGAEIRVIFNVANPALAQVTHQYQISTITQISNETRQTIQQILQDGVTNGINPRQTARQIRQYIGLTPHQLNAVQNYRRMLENKPVEALNNQLRDRRFDRTVTAAELKQHSLPKATIDKMVDRYAERYLNYRAEMIARTESIRALNMSNYQLWQNMIDEGRVSESRIRRFWLSGEDGRTRPAHKRKGGIPSLNDKGVGMKEPFKSAYGPILYPCQPGADPRNVIHCRCAVFTRLVGDRADD